jgi:hypothetical protein
VRRVSPVLDYPLDPILESLCLSDADNSFRTVKGLGTQAFKNLVADLQGRSFTLTEASLRQNQPIFNVLRTDSANGRIDAVLNARSFDFFKYFHKAQQELFAIILEAIMAAQVDFARWDDDFWHIPAVQPIKVTTNQLLFAIQSLRAAPSDTIFEQDLGGILMAHFGIPLVDVLHKGTTGPGPDGYFRSGGLPLKLANDAFFVEAKSGPTALEKAAATVLANKTIGAMRTGSLRERYREYCYTFARAKGITPAPSSALLVGLTFQTGPQPIRLPKAIFDIFDGVIAIDAFGGALRVESNN